MDDVRFTAIFNRKRRRNCISCQARARKEHAFRAHACMRYIDIARYKIYTCQTAWCYVVALFSSWRLPNALPDRVDNVPELAS